MIRGNQNKIKNKNYLIIVLVILTLTSFITNATPNINLTHGIISHKANITITGSDFGVKANASPIRYDDFDTGTTVDHLIVDDLPWWSKDSSPYQNATISDENCRNDKCGKFIVSTRADNVALRSDSIYREDIGFNSTGRMYVNFWQYIDMVGNSDGTSNTSASYQIKFLNSHRGDMYPSNVSLPEVQFSHWAYGYPPNSSWYQRTYYVVYGGNQTNNPTNTFRTPGWYQISIEMDYGDVGVANGKMTIRVTNISANNTYIVTQQTDSMYVNESPLAGRPTYPNNLRLGWYHGSWYPADTNPATGPNFTSILYYDNIYVDNTFSRIEIGDNETYDNCTHREIQIPKNWTDTNITFEFNQGSFVEGETVYLFVVDENGNASEGYPVTIESDPCLEGANFTILNATHIGACSCNQTQVQAAINNATSGMTVLVPEGNCVWSSNVSFNKSGINIIGEGIGKTNITTLGDSSVYLNILPGTSDWKIEAISWFVNATTQSRLVINIGLYRSSVTTTNWVIANCEFRLLNDYTSNFHPIYIQEGATKTRAVIFNNTFYGGGLGYDGPSDSVWEIDTALGSDNFIFVDHNTFSSKYSDDYLTSIRGIYAGNGAKLVVRYNDFLSDTIDSIAMGNPIDAHGYCHGEHTRGTRAYEIYNNTFQAGLNGESNRALYLRSGTGLVYDNLINMSIPGSYWSDHAFDLHDYRASSNAVGTLAASCSPDCPSPNGNAAFCIETYYRLNITNDPVSGTPDLLQEGQIVRGQNSGANATIWAVTNTGGYAINFLSVNSGPGGYFQEGENITVNGTIKTVAAKDLETMHGEGYPCCDQIGRGKNQQSEPYYFWNNLYDNSSLVIPDVSDDLMSGYIEEDRDYYSNTQKKGYAPFDYPHPLVSGIPGVSLLSPEWNYTTNSTNITFNCSVIDNGQLKNITLYSNFSGSWIANETKTINGTYNETSFTKTLSAGSYEWNCYACDVDGNCDWGNLNYTLNVLNEPYSNIYWISPNGTANWSNCKSATPLEGAAACTLLTANQNVQAGDTVYLRNGTYYPTGRTDCIHPGASGNSTHRITYQSYNNETVVIDGTNSSYEALLLSAGYPGGGPSQGRNYITISGMTFSNWDEFGNLYYASYNEIANCTFTGQKNATSANSYDAFEITYNSTHNYIHDNTWHNYGRYDTGDFGVLLAIGNEASEGDECGHNTVENNNFYHAGHEVIGVHSGKNNVVRNNYFHNEGWWNGSAFCQAQENGVCGYRVVYMSNDHFNTSGQTLLEGNIIAYGAQFGGPHNISGASGSGLTIGTSYNVVRFNKIFGNAIFGGRFGASTTSRTENNRVYANTFFHNGYGADDDPQAGDYHRMGFSFYETTCAMIEYNVLKNNLFYDQWSEKNKTSTVYFPAIYATVAVESCNIISNNYVDDSSYQQSNNPFTGSPNPLFVNANISNPMALTLVDGEWVGNPDLSLQYGSPAINNGTYLTITNGSGSSSATLIVDDALYFQDGTWGSDLARSSLHPDWIAIGDVDNVVEISSIDYTTNTITLVSATNWDDNDPVWLYKDSTGKQVLYGNAPDAGAYEYISLSNCSEADTNDNGVITDSEIQSYTNRWIISITDVSLNQLMLAMREWKNGC